MIISKKDLSKSNAICRLQTFMDHKEKEPIINAILIAAVLFGTSALKSPKIKCKNS